MIAMNKFFMIVATVGLFVAFLLPWKEPYLSGTVLYKEFPLVGLIPLLGLVMVILAILRKWFEVTGVIIGFLTIGIILFTMYSMPKSVSIGPYLGLFSGLLMLISSIYVLKKKRSRRYYFISNLWVE